MSLVMCHGCFDLLHYGHMLHLRKASTMGSRLVVSITADEFVNKGTGRPVFKAAERMEMVRALRFVDQVVLSNEPTAAGNIRRFKPSKFVKGTDYLLKQLNALEVVACAEVGAKIVFTDTSKFSTTELLGRLKCVSS